MNNVGVAKLWCWGGRWDLNAQISLTDEEWHKVVLPFSEFVFEDNSGAKLEIRKITAVHFAIGLITVNPRTQMRTFLIDQVKVERSKK